MKKQKKDKPAYCVICEIEGNKVKAYGEIDIGFGPAPVCKNHKEQFKHLKLENIGDFQF